MIVTPRYGGLAVFVYYGLSVRGYEKSLSYVDGVLRLVGCREREAFGSLGDDTSRDLVYEERLMAGNSSYVILGGSWILR